MFYSNIFNESNHIRKTKYDSKELELENLIKILDKMDRHIQSLWKNVIVPYLENNCEKQILFNLKTSDCNKFYDYMSQNNEIMSYVLKRITYLQKNTEE